LLYKRKTEITAAYRNTRISTQAKLVAIYETVFCLRSFVASFDCEFYILFYILVFLLILITIILKHYYKTQTSKIAANIISK